MLKYSGGEHREHRHDETGFVNTLYLVYCLYNKAAAVPNELASTNCCVPIIQKYDKSSSAFKYSCLPEHFINSKLLGFSPNKFSKEAAVQLLVDKIKSTKLEDLLTWMENQKYSKPNISFVKACFKPFKITNLDSLPDFSRVTPEDQSKSHRNAWMSNLDIKQVLVPFCKAYNVCFLGTIYLNFLNKIRPEKREQAFENSQIKNALSKAIDTSPYTRYVGFISLLQHWSVLVIDKQTKTAYHYNSQGYIPTSQFTNKFILYSYDKTRIIPSEIGKNQGPQNQVMVVDYLLHVINSLGLKKMYVNVEQSQQQDGECGMFSLVFAILLLLNYDAPNKEQLVYNFFKFFGDKRIREFRDLLFTSSTSFLVNEPLVPLHSYNKESLKKLALLLKNFN